MGLGSPWYTGKQSKVKYSYSSSISRLNTLVLRNEGANNGGSVPFPNLGERMRSKDRKSGLIFRFEDAQKIAKGSFSITGFEFLSVVK